MLPHCPRELKSGTPAAVFVSEPRLWETEDAKSKRMQKAETVRDLHQAKTSPIEVYTPAVTQKVAKYLTLFMDTVSSNLITSCQSGYKSTTPAISSDVHVTNTPYETGRCDENPPALQPIRRVSCRT